MIADLLSGVLGISLIYVAILRQPMLQSSQGMLLMAVLGVVITVLAFIAAKSQEAWYSRSRMVLGICLVLFGGLGAITALPLTLASWFVFWVGVFAAVISIWAALYPRNLEPQE